MTLPSETVAAAETHISRLFFTPDRVLKLLKPVDVGFVSFVDRASRMAAVKREHELNHRISPDVYLGLGDLVEDGEVVERLLVMRRLPADRQLDRLVGTPDFADHIADVARLLAVFHSRQEPVTGDDANMATAEQLLVNWRDNLEVLQPCAGSIVPEARYRAVAGHVERYLAGRDVLFAERIRDGRVRDGHGDLRAEHVFCLDDGPRVIDCLAFRDEYRIGDVLNDIAFLAMDLQRLAGPAAAVALVRAYDEFTDEHHPSSLAHHFVAYRAHVRAKIAAIRLGQGDDAAADDVRRYHRLAEAHLDVGQVRLVLVGGGAGTGKSTVAEAVANRLGAVWLRSDETRKALAGLDVAERAGAAPDEGLYRPEVTERVYRELLDEAELLLRRGESVVLDATWSSDRWRNAARALAGETAAALTELQCVVPLVVAEARIDTRLGVVDEPSDATAKIARFLASRFEPWPAARPIDTDRTVDSSVDEAWRAVVGDPIEPATVLTEEAIRFYLTRTSSFVAANARPGSPEGNR